METIDIFNRQRFGSEECFLCGYALDDSPSKEHIFPKWLQERCQLRDQRLTFDNGTSVPYRQLTIPCCSDCNNGPLSALENRIKLRFKSGAEELRTGSRVDLFLWLSKILYGLQFKELSLSKDRSNPEAGMMNVSEQVERLENLHGFLQGIREPVRFEAGRPWSIFVFDCHSESENDFDFVDDPLYLGLTIRIGSIAVVASLFDNGIVEEYFDAFFRKFDGTKIHPIQLSEISALFAYHSRLLSRSPKFITISGGDTPETLVVSPPLRGYSTEYPFGNRDPEMKANLLYYYWRRYGLAMQDIWLPPDSILTFLQNDDDTPKYLAADGSEIPNTSV